MAIEIWKRFRRYIGQQDLKREAEWLYELFKSEDADDWHGDSLLEIDMDNTGV